MGLWDGTVYACSARYLAFASVGVGSHMFYGHRLIHARREASIPICTQSVARLWMKSYIPPHDDPNPEDGALGRAARLLLIASQRTTYIALPSLFNLSYDILTAYWARSLSDPRMTYDDRFLLITTMQFWLLVDEASALLHSI